MFMMQSNCFRPVFFARGIQRCAASAVAGFGLVLVGIFSVAEVGLVQAADRIVISTNVSPAQLIPVSLAGFTGEVQSVLKFDLEVLGFEIVSPEQAQFNIQGSNQGDVEGRLMDRVTRTVLVGNRYSGGTPRVQAHAFADDIIKRLRGKPGIAQTRIAFKGEEGRGSEIYVADYDGANAVAVTSDKALVAAPCWSPGQLILYYTSYKSGWPDIYFHDLKTRERRIIAKYPGLNTSAAISKDGRRVAMILSKDGSPDLYVCNSDGSNLKRLTTTRESESSPCWSPDGSTICVVSMKDGAPGLYLIGADGGAMRRLRTGGATTVTEPDWSPDGETIVFTALWSRFNICVVPATGGQVTALEEGEDPSWAPNSRTVIFSRKKNGKRILSLLDVPTKRVKDVRQNSGSWSQPSWAK